MKTIVYILILLGACVVITAAHYAWHATRTFYPDLVLPVYIASIAVLSIKGYFVLSRTMRNSYRDHGRLTHRTVFLATTVWGLLFAFPAIFGPHDWAWSWSHEVDGSNAFRWISLALVLTGLTGIVFSMAWLGFHRSMGQDPDLLHTSGPYRFSRNPQIASSILLFAGYVVLRPSWFSLGWLFLIGLYAHWMTLSEEEHLHRTFGDEYDSYNRRTPRFLGIPGGPKEDTNPPS